MAETNGADWATALRTIRALRGMQQQLVAKRAGISRSQLSLIESGQRRPSLEHLERLCEVLRVPHSRLAEVAADPVAAFGLEATA